MSWSAMMANVFNRSQHRAGTMVLMTAILLIVRIEKHMIEASLEWTRAPLAATMLGSVIVFPILATVAAAITWNLSQLAPRNVGYGRHLELYLIASLLMIAYHALRTFVGWSTEFMLPPPIGWILQLAVYVTLVVRVVGGHPKPTPVPLPNS